MEIKNYPVTKFNWNEQEKEYSTSASSLGIAPGQWPVSFKVEGQGEFFLLDVDNNRGLYALAGTAIRGRIWND